MLWIHQKKKSILGKKSEMVIKIIIYLLLSIIYILNFYLKLGYICIGTIIHNTKMYKLR